MWTELKQAYEWQLYCSTQQRTCRCPAGAMRRSVDAIDVTRRRRLSLLPPLLLLLLLLWGTVLLEHEELNREPQAVAMPATKCSETSSHVVFPT